jgi:hydroxymethylglutaryl-CoA lyase
MLKIIECPRDAMQGLSQFVPTSTKIRYLNRLLQVGFHTLDFGSYVSPRAVPQMADTQAVLEGLDLSHTATRLLAIVANRRGAEAAATQAPITYLGYPFSISETFQQRNTQRSIAASLVLVEEMQDLCLRHGKQLVVYLSMAFGNPYGDPWEPAIVEQWLARMAELDIHTVALADTVGSADEDRIAALFRALIPRYPRVELGAHLHATPETRRTKVAAAHDAGCRRFDVAMQGFGGCPFAKEELTGNIATESLLAFCQEQHLSTGLDLAAFERASNEALQVFG